MVQDITYTPHNGAVLAAQEDTPSKMTGYYFDVITEHSVSFQNNITDNYLENNTAVQDHIAHAPITITLSGLSGEIVYKASQAEEDAEVQLNRAKLETNKQTIFNKLSALPVLYPPVSNTTQLFMNAYDYVSASANRYIGIIRKFRNSNNALNTYNNTTSTLKETRLQEIYRKLKLLSDNNTALWVNTPYGDFLDMYIQSLTLRQGNENFVTDIELTLKQLRFAEVTTTKVDEKVMAIYNAQARASQQNNGIAQGETTVLKDFLNKTGITTVGSGVYQR